LIRMEVHFILPDFLGLNFFSSCESLSWKKRRWEFKKCHERWVARFRIGAPGIQIGGVMSDWAGGG
jgi:hypothetical protein